MSLRPQQVPPVPDETARVARAAFPSGNIYLMLRDEIGTLAEDEDFAVLFSRYGQPAAAPWQLALVTISQLVEGLSDRAAAASVPTQPMSLRRFMPLTACSAPLRRCATPSTPWRWSRPSGSAHLPGLSGLSATRRAPSTTTSLRAKRSGRLTPN